MMPWGVPISVIFYWLLYRFLKWSVTEDHAATNRFPDYNGSPSLRSIGLVTLGYTILTLAVFSQYLPEINTAIIGPCGDNLMFLWNLSWFDSTLRTTGDLHFTKLICYPQGTSLVYHSISYYSVVVGIPLQNILGLTMAYNVLILHTFVIGGLGAFLLVYYFTGDAPISFISGSIFAFGASHVAHSMHHLNIASIQFLPFFLLFLIKSMRSGRKRDTVLASLFFLLGTLTSWTNMVMQLYLLLGLYLFIAAKQRRFYVRSALRRIGFIGGTTAIILAPLLFRLLWTGLTNPAARKSGYSVFVADFLAFVTPPPTHVFGATDFIQSINQQFTGFTVEATVYLGIPSLVIMLAFLPRVISRFKPLVAMTLGSLILSMGIQPHLLGKPIPLILPGALMSITPLLGLMRVPSRFIVIACLGVSILVGVSLRHCKLEGRLGKYSKVACYLLMTFLMIDLMPVISDRCEVALPNCYAEILADHRVSAILDVPAEDKYVNHYMAYQALHGVPIVQGRVARKLEPTLIDSLKLYHIELWPRHLEETGISHIVYHKILGGKAQYREVQFLSKMYAVVYDDSSHIVFLVNASNMQAE